MTTTPALNDDHRCPICAEPMNDGDLCATDIDMGTCHAACLDGSTIVDLETGEPSPGPVATFSYERDAALNDDLVRELREGAQSIDSDGTPAQVGPSPKILHQSATALETLAADNAALRSALAGCQWYWPENDTSSEMCADGPHEVVEAAYGWETPSGEIVAVARGGVVEVTYCACLPPAEDADSDDEFWVEEATEEAARAKIAAEIERRTTLTGAR